VIRLAIRVRRAQAEVVLAELLELAPSGVEEIELDDGHVEYAVYGAPGELPNLPDLRAAAGDALVEISTSETADDWQERWREFHRPIVVRAGGWEGEGGARDVHPRGSASRRDIPDALYVRPPWEAPASDGSGTSEIVIDPGRAFGTGAHATTRMCLQLLLDLATAGLAGGPLIDLGTGSGVLAIAAARVGFAPVLALDHEVESVQAARENAAVNRAEIQVERFDLRFQTLASVGRSALLANLLLPLLLDLSRSIEERPTQLIASGLLREQADEAADAFGSALGLRERCRLHDGEWAALWLA